MAQYGTFISTRLILKLASSEPSVSMVYSCTQQYIGYNK
jgi:hypothetical protein